MRSLRLVLAALVLGVGLSMLGAGPAFACSCAEQTPADHAERADVVFAGTLTEVAEPLGLPVVSSVDETTYTFEVDTVYVGDPAPETSVRSAWSGASCGLEGMTPGDRYVVFAHADGPGLAASLCGGTAPASPRLENAVVEALGPGVLPDPTGTVGAAPPPPLPSVLTPWLWVGGLVAVVGPLWWALSRRTTG